MGVDNITTPCRQSRKDIVAKQCRITLSDKSLIERCAEDGSHVALLSLKDIKLGDNLLSHQLLATKG
jgi:hypothetical protein